MKRLIAHWMYVLVVFVILAGFATLSDAEQVNTDTAQFFDSIQTTITELPPEVVNSGGRNSLSKKLNNATVAYERGQPCTAAHKVEAFNNALAAFLKTRPGIPLDLYNQGQVLRNQLLSTLPPGETCHGQWDNTAPSADAGYDRYVFVSETVVLDGSGSTDPEDDPLSFQWSLVSSPDGSTVALSASDTAQPTYVPDIPGLYVIQLVVNDGKSASTPDTVSILAGKYLPEIVLDESNTKSGVITPDGGSLTTTGADGTLYTLTLPEHALLSPIEISITPVLSMTGTPISDTTLNAVRLSPSGLQLQELAILTIQPPTALPGQVIGLISENTGAAIELISAEVNGNIATLQLSHFSIVSLLFDLEDLALLDDILEDAVYCKICSLAREQYFGSKGVLEQLKGATSCADLYPQVANEVVEFRNVSDYVGDTLFLTIDPGDYGCIFDEPIPCQFNPTGDTSYCESIWELGDAGQHSLANVIKFIFEQANEACLSGDQSQDLKALKCLDLVSRMEGTPWSIIEDELWSQKDCGIGSLAIDPQSACLYIGETEYFTVEARGTDGSLLQDQDIYPMSLMSLNPAIADVDATGVTTGLSEGDADILAFLEGVNPATLKDVADVHVAPAVLLTIVLPSGGVIDVGETLELNVTLLDTEGNEVDPSTVEWSVSNTNSAQAAPQTGGKTFVTGKAPGDVEVNASYDDGCQQQIVTAYITVQAPVSATIVQARLGDCDWADPHCILPSLSDPIPFTVRVVNMQGSIIDPESDALVQVSVNVNGQTITPNEGYTDVNGEFLAYVSDIHVLRPLIIAEAIVSSSELEEPEIVKAHAMSTDVCHDGLHTSVVTPFGMDMFYVDEVYDATVSGIFSYNSSSISSTAHAACSATASSIIGFCDGRAGTGIRVWDTLLVIPNDLRVLSELPDYSDVIIEAEPVSDGDAILNVTEGSLGLATASAGTHTVLYQLRETAGINSFFSEQIAFFEHRYTCAWDSPCTDEYRDIFLDPNPAIISVQDLYLNPVIVVRSNISGGTSIQLDPRVDGSASGSAYIDYSIGINLDVIDGYIFSCSGTDY